MSDLLYDLESGEALLRVSVDLAVTSDGRTLLRMSENTAVETESGKLHFVTHWGLEEDSAESDWTIFP